MLYAGVFLESVCLGYIDGEFMPLVSQKLETFGVQLSGKLQKLQVNIFTLYSLDCLEMIFGQNSFSGGGVFGFLFFLKGSCLFFICDIQHSSHICTLLSEMLNHFLVYFSRSLK